MPNGSDGTLDKVLSKLTPRIIAIVLIAVVLAFTVVISIALNKGAGINFWGVKISSKDSGGDKTTVGEVVGGMTAQEFIATLPSDLRGTVDESGMKIATTLKESKQKSEEIESLKKQIDAIGNKEDKFLNRILRLEDEIARWEGSINTSIKVDEKEDVFRLVQQLLRRIGYYDGPIDADPFRTQETLKNYKLDKGFKDVELLTHVTRQTVIFMVRDYAETLLKESRG